MTDSLTLQLLGFAFASADLLFEVDADGQIVTAVGAGATALGLEDRALKGMSYEDLFAAGDHAPIAQALGAVSAGQRTAPLAVRLRNGATARLSAFALPQLAPHLSCALDLRADTQNVDASAALKGPMAFASVAGQALSRAASKGRALNLDLVELDGFDDAMAGMEAAAARRAREAVAAAMADASYGGAGATEVAKDKYAVLRDAGAPTAPMTAQIEAVAGVKPKMASLSLGGATPAQNMRALRFALDRFIEDGTGAAKATFEATMQRTLRDTERFRRIVADRAFHLAYQPVVSLADESLHHCEALARFDADGSPADTIRLAEELDMIQDFDLAVAEQVTQVLTTGQGVRIAVNISSRSLMQTGFVERLLNVTRRIRRDDLLFEITESAALGDLTLANHQIQLLRQAGHEVCLDDFGAGSATLEYLRDLHVDFLKIDGRYIREVENDSRGVILLRHLVAMCRELNVPTIAEMVEGRETARLAADLGVCLGQGWLYGKPQASLPQPVAKPPPARRRGAVEQWG